MFVLYHLPKAFRTLGFEIPPECNLPILRGDNPHNLAHPTGPVTQFPGHKLDRPLRLQNRETAARFFAWQHAVATHAEHEIIEVGQRRQDLPVWRSFPRALGDSEGEQGLNIARAARKHPTTEAIKHIFCAQTWISRHARGTTRESGHG